jgi:hypothetical protein
MQIDESDEQDQNAYPSIRETLHPNAKITLETNLFPKKQRQPRLSISSGIMIAAECPKHLMIDLHSKLTKNSHLIFKSRLPSAIEISSRFVSSKTPSPIPESVAGMQIDGSDEQDENAYAPIRESLQPDSNLTLESAVHPLKQRSQRSSTEDGMQTDTKTGHLSEPDSDPTTATNKTRPPKQTKPRGQNNDSPSPDLHEITPPLFSYTTSSTIIPKSPREEPASSGQADMRKNE